VSSQIPLGSALLTRLSGTALTSLLSGGTAIPSVFFEQAPDKYKPPYVIFLFPSEQDDNTSPRRLKDVVARVYGVALNAEVAGTIDNVIDGMLHRNPLPSASGWKNIRLQRENGYQLISTSASGMRYYTSGADYRAEITTTP
jgi:hypothetical protein